MPSSLITYLRRRTKTLMIDPNAGSCWEKSQAGELCQKRIDLLLDNPVYFNKIPHPNKNMSFYWSTQPRGYTLNPTQPDPCGEQSAGCSAQQQMFAKNTLTAKALRAAERFPHASKFSSAPSELSTESHHWQCFLCSQCSGKLPAGHPLCCKEKTQNLGKREQFCG